MGESGLGGRAPRRREAPPEDPRRPRPRRRVAGPLKWRRRRPERARGGGGSRARERAAPANDTPARRCAARAPPLRRYGFVEFEDSRDADDAVYELNSKELCGERVIVEHARGPRRDRDGYSYGSRSESLPPRAPRPGYLGGGVGGGRGAGAVTGGAGWDLPSPGRRGGRGLSALGVPGAPLPPRMPG